MKLLNWLLYETHRWLGIVLAVFMFVWFASGLVIMYSTPTTQTKAQQFAHAEHLSPQTDWLSVGEVWERSAPHRNATQKSDSPSKPASIADARLVSRLGEPLWLIEDTRGQRFALSAIDGTLRETTPEQAVKIAQNWFSSEENVQVNFLKTVENTIILRNQDALKPFHHIAASGGKELLISAKTGEVLHASTRLDRAFYYAGNWIHLFKPLEAIGLGNIRHDVQLWSGLGATIATLTGLIIGWLRWRPGFAGKKTYSQGRTQPYRESWMKWHFWTGLIGGTFALFWAFSGFIDTNPNKIFSEGNTPRPEVARYLGETIPDALKNWQPAPLSISNADIVEIDAKRLGNETVILAYSRDGERIPQAVDGTLTQFSNDALLEAAKRLVPNTQVVNTTILNDYDSYYYPRHNQGLVEKPLPVTLVELADEAKTHLYLDAQDGRILANVDSSRRVVRWLFNALHYWDFGWFYYRPIWDIWMIAWVSFGVVLGASSIVVGWRRLKKTANDLAKSSTKIRVVAKESA